MDCSLSQGDDLWALMSSKGSQDVCTTEDGEYDYPQCTTTEDGKALPIMHHKESNEPVGE